MGGGQKRGRTQRRHFKQGRENVWKYNNKKNRPDSDESPNPNPASNSNPNPTWEPFISQNPAFEEYYKKQGIVPEDEWEEFLGLLRKALPAAFRINSSGQFFHEIRSQLQDDFMKALEAETNNENEVEAIRPLPWYPENLAWHLNFSRMQLRKNQTLERFHEFLKQENEVGNITRQEAVSMVPPLFLDVLPDHHILDMCAAPGSKTFQLLEMIHQSVKPGLLPNGLVIANDVDVQRCNLLIHQTKRMCSANLIVTNHEAQYFPSFSRIRDCLDGSKEGPNCTKKDMLQFDRILCDVPCSGDGTLRKAPDLWRKWNAGMGNGLHRLQVEIAMRGVTLLKVGGRMVYSTCSMNPVENEAVVSEVLRRSGGSVELLDVSKELPELVCRQGLKTWKVRDKGLWLSSYSDVPNYRRSVIVPSMFPSNKGCMESKMLCEEAQEGGSVAGVETPLTLTGRHSVDSDHKSGNSKSSDTLADASIGASTAEEDLAENADQDDRNGESELEGSNLPLERCLRIVPHDQNSGAFFIAVLQKLSPLQAVLDSPASQVPKGAPKIPATVSEEPVAESKSDTGASENDPNNSQHTAAEERSDAIMTQDQAVIEPTEVELVSHSDDVRLKDNASGKENAGDNVTRKDAKHKLQHQGKWRGVDPVVFFRDETTINSIRSFYGISESLPFEDCLVTRNSDATHVKRIYYISKSVRDILQLNFQVGQRLKITSLGLKVFERQASKDASSTCAFRLSSEGLPLLLPYICKQILCASLADFQHLLQYRTIKFADFVDASFGEKASNLMLGCCVIVLNEGNQSLNEIIVDASTIAIVCWKGKTNISIMVSELDAKELLGRLAVRFGSKSPALSEKNEDISTETDPINSTDDIEPMEEQGAEQ